jgi:hypothetical protein
VPDGASARPAAPAVTPTPAATAVVLAAATLLAVVVGFAPQLILDAAALVSL